MASLSSNKQHRPDAPTPAPRPTAAHCRALPPNKPPGTWVLVGASGPNDYREALEQLAELLEALDLARLMHEVLKERHWIAVGAVRRFEGGMD